MNIISFSGGKDSTVMVIRMFEEGTLDSIDKIVFADTGVEFEEMYEYIEKVEKYIGRKITVVKGDVTWDQWFYGTFTSGKHKGITRGFPPAIGMGCWAKRELKVKALRRLEGKNNTVCIGIAKDEIIRTKRGQYAPGNPNNNIYRFPLIEWNMTEQNCIDYLKERGLHNPLYDRFKRLGCWMCPKQGGKALYTLWKYYPKKWEQLKKYEKDSPNGFKPVGTFGIKKKYILEDLEERFKRKLYIEENQMSMFKEEN